MTDARAQRPQELWDSLSASEPDEFVRRMEQSS